MSTNSMPHVPITQFKANPARYLQTGAIVTNPGKARVTFLPVGDDADFVDRAMAAKAMPRLLYRVQHGQDVAAELEELSAQRGQDIVDEPR